MRKILSFAFAILMATAAFAQNPILRQRLEIAEFEREENGTHIEVFQMQDNGKYYLSVGNLGVGTDFVQIQFDPVFELFIPLGETLSEAIETMEGMKEFYKMSRKETKIIEGCLSALYPNEKFEPVKVTRRQMLTERLLEFSLEYEGIVRATYLNKAEFSTLLSGLKFYKKLHPKVE